jgi:hypothetical protein
MALPPLVVTGAIISAAHINSIRNHLGTWSTTVSAGGNDLTNVGTITANVGAFGGSITSPAISTANIGVSGVMSATSAAISGTATVGSLQRIPRLRRSSALRARPSSIWSVNRRIWPSIRLLGTIHTSGGEVPTAMRMALGHSI